MDSLPILRLELQGMQATITRALLEHQSGIHKEMEKAVAEFCQPENISSIVHRIAKSALEQAIKREVEHFFLHGDGRGAVAKAVKEAILKKETYTPLDSVDDKLTE